MKLNTFNKNEKLYLDADIEALWHEGRRFTAYPLRIVCRTRNDGYGVRVMVIARKRQFHHAVDRNRWKRVVREAYRLQKHALDGMNTDICFMVLGNDLPRWDKVNAAMTKALEKITKPTA